MGRMVNDFSLIPAEALTEIEFMLGDATACDEILRPILERHGYDVSNGGCLCISADEDKELALDIYRTVLTDESVYYNGIRYDKLYEHIDNGTYYTPSDCDVTKAWLDIRKDGIVYQLIGGRLSYLGMLEQGGVVNAQNR